MADGVTLSIIIPVYNGEKFVARALDSILSQPSSDYEIIIVNDGSTDNSGEIIERYENQYSAVKLINSSHHGVCHTRNVGIENANGKYILFFDQDDIFFKGAYNSDLSNRLDEYYCEGVDIFCFRFVKSDDTIQRFYTEPTRKQSGKDNKVYMVSGLPTHFAIYNVKLFHENGLRFMESRYKDLDMQFMHLLFYYADKIVYDNNVLLYCWVMHLASESHSFLNLEKNYYDDVKYWKKTADLHYAQGDNDAKRFCENRVCALYCIFLREYYKRHISEKSIRAMTSKLQVEDIVKDYYNVYNDETRNGLSCYYNHRAKFIIDSRVEKYIECIGSFLIKHINLFKKKYLKTKYPLSMKELLESFENETNYSEKAL